MKQINRFGFRVAGLTVLLLLVVFGLYWGGRALWQRWQNPSAEERILTDEDRRRDSDGDGVADLYETSYYGTNPESRDTDGDGTSDLDEILAGRNPAVADQDGFKPPTGEAVTAPDTFTQKYLASLPVDIPREEILDEIRLSAFVEANKGPLLPEIAASRLRITSASGQAAVAAYLDATSASHNQAIVPVANTDLEAAFREHAAARNTEPLQQIIGALTRNLGVLEGAAAPTEVEGLHRKQVAATEALLRDARLLQTVDADFVGSLIAAKRIEDLGVVFQEIAAEVAALEGKYQIE